MLWTLQDAIDKLGRFVDAGSCRPAVITARINEALERLTDSDDLTIMQKFMRICVCNGCLPLPFNVEKILWADIDGTPANVFGYPYQFLSSGPGDLDMRGGGSCFKDLVVKDYSSPLMFDIPTCFTDDGEEVEFEEGLQLIAFSTDRRDVTLPDGVSETPVTLRVQGFGQYAREINPGLDPGVDVPIHYWKAGTVGRIAGRWNEKIIPTTTKFTSVTRVVKDVTYGSITLYAVDPVENYFFFLAEFHPRVKIPEFTRYSITNKSIGTRSSVLALVKMRNVELTQPGDVLPIDSLESLKNMVIAIRQENQNDFSGAKAYETDARRLMGNREKSRTNTGGVPVIMNRDYRTSLGRHMNRGGRIL